MLNFIVVIFLEGVYMPQDTNARLKQRLHTIEKNIFSET